MNELQQNEVGSRFSLLTVIQKREFAAGAVVHPLSGWWSYNILALCPSVQRLVSIDERAGSRVVSAMEDARYVLSQFGDRSEWVNGQAAKAIAELPPAGFIYLNQPNPGRSGLDFADLLAPAWQALSDGGLLMVDGYRKGTPGLMQPLVDFAARHKRPICLTSEPWICTAVLEKSGGLA